ncbi:hypothetical protein Pelo_15287 [Pelomyxa schiedti]|nr:hypothetical protein Pelo_15287 [Pelomyxa schiedti]
MRRYDGASFGVLGVELAIVQVPLAVFTALMYAKETGAVTWTWWAIFAPMLLIALLFALAGTQRTSAPHTVRVACVLGVVCFAATILMIIFKLEYNSAVLENLVILYIPIWAFPLGLTAIGIYSIFRGRQQTRHVLPTGSHSQFDIWRNTEYHTIGVGLICLGVLLGLIVSLIFLKETGLLNASWTIIFVPWWILDSFSFIVGGFLILFTLGAPSDALFPIYQLLNFLAILLACMLFEIFLAIQLDGDRSLAYYSPYIAALVAEFLFATCGIGMLIGKNRRKSLFKRRKPLKPAKSHKQQHHEYDTLPQESQPHNPQNISVQVSDTTRSASATTTAPTTNTTTGLPAVTVLPSNTTAVSGSTPDSNPSSSL